MYFTLKTAIILIWLSETIEFPSYENATDDGVLALGGDLSEKRLIHAYENGVFPWFSEGEPIVWYCPSVKWPRRSSFQKLESTLC